MTGKIILAEIEVERENISGFELSIWGTIKEKRSKIEKNTTNFWKWLDDDSTDKIMYYNVLYGEKT